MAKTYIYKIGFYVILILLICSWGYIFWDKNKSSELIQQKQSQIAKVSDDNLRNKAEFDNVIVRLDSVTFQNEQLSTDYLKLLSKLKIKNPKDSLIRNLTGPQARMVRLMDSINAIHDSINLLNEKIIQIRRNTILDRDQSEQLKNAFAILANVSVTLDFALDNESLNVLKENTNSLKAIVTKFDKKIAKLDKLSQVLVSFSKYLQIAIDVFTAAVSQGLLTPAQGAMLAK